MRKWLTIVLAVMLGACLWAPGPASAKGTKDACKKADAKLAQTGVGDSDGDGASDCRESRYLHTFLTDPDSDDDGMSDGEEYTRFCDPLDQDSDDDGINDGDDESPAVKQKVEALLDALICPQIDVPGSITALGITAKLDMNTEFEDTSCAGLETLLAGGGNVFVEIKILENVLGELTATEVELEHPDRDDDEHDD